MATPFAPITTNVLDYDEVMARFEIMLDWLAGTYVNALNVIHYMHDRYAYERIEMALHDMHILRTMACGIAGLSVVADSLSAIKYAKVHVIRDENGLAVDYRTTGKFQPLATTTTVSMRSPPRWSRTSWKNCASIRLTAMPCIRSRC